MGASSSSLPMAVPPLLIIWVLPVVVLLATWAMVVCPLSATVTLPMTHGTSAVSSQAVPSGSYRNLGVASGGLSALSNGSAPSGRYVRL